MLEQLTQWEHTLLFVLNGSNSSYLDQVVWVYTGKLIWLPLVVALLWSYLRKGGKEAALAIAMTLLVVVVCDQVAASIFRPLFERLRPTRNPDIAPMLQLVHGYTGGMYGFISAHAANGFGIALFTSLVYRKRYFTFTVFLWAALSCYTRLYLGVHYPSDILAGAAVGMLIGWLIYLLYKELHRTLYHRGIYSRKQIPYAQGSALTVPITFYILLVVILVAAPFWDFRF